MQNFKIYILVILTGIVTGFVTIPYRWLIQKSFYLREGIFNLNNSLFNMFIIIICIYAIGLCVYILVEKIPFISGSGIPQVKAQIYGREKINNPIKYIICKFIGGVSSISIGFSLGREGPSVQIGALVGDAISKIFKTNEVERKYLIMSGASSGLSSAFTAPLASAIFIAEELQKYFNSRLIMFSFLGSIISGSMAAKFFSKNEYANILIKYPSNLDYIEHIYIAILFSLFISLVGKIFSFLLIFFQTLKKKIEISKYIKVFFYINMLIIIGFLFTDMTAGGEDFLIKQMHFNNMSLKTLILFIVLKLLFTTMSYSTGFPGGIFLPLLVIGGLSGKLFGLFLLNFNIIEINNLVVFMLLGMASIFVVVVRSPATGIILLLEMTLDFTLLPSMIVIVGLSYTISYMIGITPIYDLLYKSLILNDTNNELTNLVFQLGDESYLVNKKIINLTLPGKLRISSLERNGLNIKIDKNTELKNKDIIGISIKRKNIEKFYDALRALTQEN